MYYWSFGILVRLPTFIHPLYTPPGLQFQIILGLVLFVVSELCNFAVRCSCVTCGQQDRRSATSKFCFVMCRANYFFWSPWLGWFLVDDQCRIHLHFTLLGFSSNVGRAMKKHMGVKAYGSEYKRNSGEAWSFRLSFKSSFFYFRLFCDLKADDYFDCTSLAGYCAIRLPGNPTTRSIWLTSLCSSQ
jgi:hypothetical protein